LHSKTYGLEGQIMKRSASLLFSFFVLSAFQLAFANTNGADIPLEQAFSSPEQTWSIFKKAILEEDFDTAQKCCCQDKTNGVLKFKKMTKEKRKSIVQSMQELKKIQQQEDKAKYKLSRNSNGVVFSTFVYFEKINAEWKIATF